MWTHLPSSAYGDASCPRLPVWVGVGGSPESVVRTARHGLPMVLAIIGGSSDRFAPFADLFRRAYGVRSNLVHAAVGAARPSTDTVRDLYGPMVWVVRDLILARAGASGWPHPLDRTV